MPRYEFSEGSSSKFWEIELSGASFSVRFGRIGTSGQAQSKKFKSPAVAAAEAEKLIAEKTRKGYRKVGGGKQSGVRASGSAATKPAERAEDGAAAFPARLPLPTYGKGVAFSVDHRLCAIDSSTARSFARSGECVAFPPVDGYTDAIATSPTEPLVVVTSGQEVSLFSSTGKRLAQAPLTEGTDTGQCVAFSPDGGLFAVSTGHLNSEKTTLELFSSAGKAVRVITDDRGFGIAQVCFASDGKQLITVRDGELERWPISGGAPKRRKAAVLAAESLSGAGGLVLISGGPSAKRGIALLDEAGKIKWQKQMPVQRAVLAPDASLLVVGHQRDLTLLSPAGKSLRTISRKSTHEVRSLAISVDGWLAVGTDDGVELYPLSEPSAAGAKKASPKGAKNVKKTATASGKASGKTGKGVGAAWSRIEAWLGTNAPSALKSLARGASQKNIAAAEKKLGRSFPSELKESLARHDGDDSSGLIGNWDLLGLSGLLAEATLMNKLLAEGTFGDAQGDAHPRIKRAWWNAAWIPIASSGSGHLFCVDLDPAPQGKVGQVIVFLHDDGKRFLVADSLAEWLNAVARDLEADKYEYLSDNESWSDDAFMLSAQERWT